MGNLEIIRRNGEKVRLFSKEPFCTLKSATQNCSLMGDDNVQLSIVSSELLNFGKGDKIIVEGEEYTIRTKVNREMISDNHYVHDATFYGVMYELMKSLYRNTDANGKSSKSTFDLTYNIRDFVKVLIYNVSRDYPGLWAFDEANCPDTEPRTISFARNNCLQVLQTLCSDREFDLEFLITQKDGVRTIHIGKFGAKVVPPGGNAFFEWGKGNGLYKLKEQKVDDKTIITRLWVEGGTTNIRSDYRDYSERLQLPFPVRLNKKEHKLWDGTIVPPQSEYIGISDDNNRYMEDGDLRDALGSDEDAVVYDDIFPKRTGTVTALVADDINSFIDDTMDFDLNEKDGKSTKYLINKVSAKITFISGKLAGQQFELAQKGGYDHATKRFTLIPFTDNRGLTIPTTESEAYRMTEGDTYKITDIHLPKSYEDDAEEDLWYAGYNEFKPRTQARAQYQLTFERSYFLNALPSDSETTVFHVGDYVPVKDGRFGIEKNIRIQKVTKNLLVEHDYTLTLSDITAISPITQTVVDVGRHETIIENNRLRDLTKARRGWRTTEELRSMVYDTDGYFDPDNIRPNSIDTNMLTVGAKSQQFVLTGCVLQPNFEGDPNRFVATEGVLSHLTIDNDKIRIWQMNEASFELHNTGGYYLYAKCSKSGKNGMWHITQEQLRFETDEDANNYYFQVGILGSVHADDYYRDFTTTYGFTRINGNTITTGKIITSDKECYLDLDGNKFRIGDSSSSIDWNVSADKALTLRGCMYQSPSGDIDYPEVDRGDYNSSVVYYPGDKVKYDGNVYKCIKQTSAGFAPTNSTYWKILVSRGADGKPGDPGMPGKPGDPGADGLQGPAAPYRGEYSSSKVYYGNTSRTDIVSYNGKYYVARTDNDAGEGFSAKPPTNTAWWKPFGATFESVATDLLLSRQITAGEINTDSIIAKHMRTATTGPRIVTEGTMMHVYGNESAANIRFGVDTDGRSTLSYYDDNGKFLYDLGPDGIRKQREPSFEPVWIAYVGAYTSGMATMDQIIDVQGSDLSGTACYRYDAGNSSLKPGDSSKQGCYYKTNGLDSSGKPTGTALSNGWYTTDKAIGVYSPEAYAPYSKPDSGVGIQEAGLHTRRPVLERYVVKINAGKPVTETTAYWNKSNEIMPTSLLAENGIMLLADYDTPIAYSSTTGAKTIYQLDTKTSISSTLYLPIAGSDGKAYKIATTAFKGDKGDTGSLTVTDEVYKPTGWITGGSKNNGYIRFSGGNGIIGLDDKKNRSNLWLNWYNGGTQGVKIDIDGALHYYKLYQLSDIRYKTKIDDITNVLQKLENINVFRYTRKDMEDKIMQIGVSAQAVREAFPEAVTYVTDDPNKCYFTLDYIQFLTAVSVGGLKELHKIVKEQGALIDEFRGRIVKLEGSAT